MTDRDAERGLGRVVYSVEPENQESRADDGSPTLSGSAAAREAERGDQVVEEASEESFPASDPPGYAIGRADPVTKETD